VGLSLTDPVPYPSNSAKVAGGDFSNLPFTKKFLMSVLQGIRHGFIEGKQLFTKVSLTPKDYMDEL
jgi:hypothetical protein